jgi:DNA-binding GntR family transcriptional regulator
MSAAAAKGDRDSWIAHDKIFHETVIRAANNEMIADVSRVTRRRIQRFWARSVSGARDLVTCSDEHTEIAQAIIGKDMSGIKKSVEGHLGHLRVNMHEIVASMAPFFGDQA